MVLEGAEIQINGTRLLVVSGGTAGAVALHLRAAEPPYAEHTIYVREFNYADRVLTAPAVLVPPTTPSKYSPRPQVFGHGKGARKQRASQFKRMNHN